MINDLIINLLFTCNYSDIKKYFYLMYLLLNLYIFANIQGTINLF